jgi:hypothetical protein
MAKKLASRQRARQIAEDQVTVCPISAQSVMFNTLHMFDRPPWRHTGSIKLLTVILESLKG